MGWVQTPDTHHLSMLLQENYIACMNHRFLVWEANEIRGVMWWFNKMVHRKHLSRCLAQPWVNTRSLLPSSSLSSSPQLTQLASCTKAIYCLAQPIPANFNSFIVYEKNVSAEIRFLSLSLTLSVWHQDHAY